MKYTHIIWDWNGTLLNDMEFCLETMNGILRQRGLRPISSTDEYRSLFCFPVSDYYDKLGFDYESESFETLAHIYIERYIMGAVSCPLFPGTTDVLDALKKAGKTQIILSASEINALNDLIVHYSIEHYFDKILALNDHYAVSKLVLGKNYIDDHGIDSHNVLLIGDTVHDYEVALALNCDCILISNGHQSMQTLSATGVEIISDIKDVIKYAI